MKPRHAGRMYDLAKFSRLLIVPINQRCSQIAAPKDVNL